MIASSRGFNPNTPPSAVSLSDAYWKSLSTGHSWVLAFSQRKLEGGEISQLWALVFGVIAIPSMDLPDDIFKAFERHAILTSKVHGYRRSQLRTWIWHRPSIVVKLHWLRKDNRWVWGRLGIIARLHWLRKGDRWTRHSSKTSIKLHTECWCFPATLQSYLLKNQSQHTKNIMSLIKL
nr:hypothetical protein Iba_chr04aCG13700 [Ipomoea batatas]